jgi:outer membrane protein TolC
MTEAAAILEFREASAALRRAYGARDDARVDQILADTRMAEATLNLNDAQVRLAAADAALQTARAEPPTPADIDVTRSPLMSGVTFVETTLNGSGE